MLQGLHFLPCLVVEGLCTCGKKALYMWRGEGFKLVYVERSRLCICKEEKALYMWRGEGFAYVEI